MPCYESGPSQCCAVRLSWGWTLPLYVYVYSCVAVLVLFSLRYTAEPLKPNHAPASTTSTSRHCLRFLLHAYAPVLQPIPKPRAECGWHPGPWAKPRTPTTPPPTLPHSPCVGRAQLRFVRSHAPSPCRRWLGVPRASALSGDYLCLR